MTKVKANAKGQRNYRAREQAMRNKSREIFDGLPVRMQKTLIRDMRFIVSPTKLGTYIVTWDMSKDTDEFLRELAKVYGLEFDNLMGYLNHEILIRAQQGERDRRN